MIEGAAAAARPARRGAVTAGRSDPEAAQRQRRRIYGQAVDPDVDECVVVTHRRRGRGWCVRVQWPHDMWVELPDCEAGNRLAIQIGRWAAGRLGLPLVDSRGKDDTGGD